MYQVIDIQTKAVMGKYKTLRAASRAVDRLDRAYGGCRYVYQYVGG
ncbi:MAG: hypothetical protein ACYDB1_13135 [Acidiferrobacteraceae bacterium]